MRSTRFRRALGTALVALVLLPFASGCDSDSGSNLGLETSVTVMTRNLYLGGNLFDLLDPACEKQITVCVAQLYQTVVLSNIPDRMDAVAAEIEANNPDLIGLQEVSLYRRDAVSDFSTNPVPNATEVTFDFLQILLDALEARGLDYRVVATNTNADVEFPSTPAPEVLQDIRLTDRDVILARADVTTGTAVERTFDPLITAVIDVGGFPIAFTRGYSTVEATKDDVTFTFANAHLEVGGAAAQAQIAQAAVLTGAVQNESPLVLVGDFNSNPADAGDDGESYRIITGPFNDAWTDLRSGDSGFTCCQADDLRNATSMLDTRIDLILYNGDVTATSIGRVGADTNDQTPGGLWPSDHAGVVSTLTVRN